MCKFVSIYRSPSQASDAFEKFRDNFKLTLDTLTESNSHLIVVLGDLKIKSKNWYINDKTTTEGAKIEFVTLHKKWSFPLSISSANMTKSAVSWEFDHIYWRYP